jgi:hypothetical protein
MEISGVANASRVDEIPRGRLQTATAILEYFIAGVQIHLPCQKYSLIPRPSTHSKKGKRKTGPGNQLLGLF